MSEFTPAEVEVLQPAGEPAGEVGPKKLNMNRYATKKTIAQGLFDVALLSANASLLKFLVQVKGHHPFFALSITLTILSIVLQIIVGVCLLYLGMHNINEEQNYKKINFWNNVIVALIFLISVINIFLSSFGMDYTPTV
ncbi:unnamed protein product [Allacma fusca]|uniref:Ninjurin-1 n=1 Tax=Allacma fusca TaxID=39272 RepID=A0A8J2LHL1_9HEXA|nr:unnamed protein product [Allacma fusca]